MRNGILIWLSTLGLLACSRERVQVGDDGGGGHAGGAGGSGGGTGGGGGSTPDTPQAGLAATTRDGCLVIEGKVYCWGYNDVGQIGIPPSTNWLQPPREVPGLNDVAGVTKSYDHACAFTLEGDVYCWGANYSGQIGGNSAPAGTCVNLDTQDVPCQPTPTRVAGVAGAVEVAASLYRSCARLSDGRVSCWGDVGNLLPWAQGVTAARSLTVARRGACAVVASGALSCSFEIPVDVQAWRNLRRVVMEDDSNAYPTAFACALDEAGGVRCFGDSTYGQLGDNLGALPAARSDGAADIALGGAHACALGTDGSVQCWGRNFYGEISFPLESPSCPTSDKATCELTPRAIGGMPALTAIGSGAACGIAADGTVWCWGNGAPIRVPGPWDAKADACFETLNTVAWRRINVVEAGSQSCASDADCTAIALDLSCDHACGVAPRTRDQYVLAVADMANLESQYCAQARDAGCPSPTLSCPDQHLRPICDSFGHCTLDDPARTGCTDHCACELEGRRSLAARGITSTCDGFDLWVADGVSCGQCRDSFVYLTIHNRGTVAFNGNAVLSFESVSAPVVPDPMTLHLNIPPGEFSAPIKVLSRSAGYAAPVITAAGDCAAWNDDITWATFPSPTNPCP